MSHTFLDCATLAVMLTPVSVGLLTAPAWLAVRRLVRRRFTAPLERGTLQRWLILCAAMVGACGAVLHADGIAAAIVGRPRDAFVLGSAALVFLAPAPLAAIPWAAGEMLGGESERQGLAFLSSIATAYALSLGTFLFIGPEFILEGPSIAPVATQFSATALAALGSAGAYLALRGEPLEPAPPEALALERVLRDYSSSMSEKRSLAGCSSGFF